MRIIRRIRKLILLTLVSTELISGLISGLILGLIIEPIHTAFAESLPTSSISGAPPRSLANITIPPMPPEPQIPSHAETQAQKALTPSVMPSTSTSVDLPTAWILQFNSPLEITKAQALAATYQQKSVPAFLIPALSHQAYVAIGPEIDKNRLILLETRVNIDPNLVTVRGFELGS